MTSSWISNVIAQTEVTMSSLSSGTSEDEERASDSGYSSGEDISGSDQYDASDEDSADLDFQIQYLASKQELLCRASAVFNSDDAYEAAAALTTLQPPKPSAVLEEAKSVLSNFPEERSRSNKRAIPTTSEMSSRKRKNSSPGCNIDTSHVQRLTGESYHPEEHGRRISPEAYKTMFEGLSAAYPNMFLQGQWMAQALVQSAPCPPADAMSLWRVVSSPSTRTLRLAPPFGTPIMEQAMDMEQAISLSGTPRVLTLSIPPFPIVFANRAFLQLDVAKKNGTGEESLICKPIESVVQVHVEKGVDGQKESDLQENTTANIFQGVLPLCDNKACGVQVFPVVDKSRFGPGDDDDDSENQMMSMSHILLQVTFDGAFGHDEDANTNSLSVQQPSKSSSHSPSPNEKRRHHVVVGTVG